MKKLMVTPKSLWGVNAVPDYASMLQTLSSYDEVILSLPPFNSTYEDDMARFFQILGMIKNPVWLCPQVTIDDNFLDTFKHHVATSLTLLGSKYLEDMVKGIHLECPSPNLFFDRLSVNHAVQYVHDSKLRFSVNPYQVYTFTGSVADNYGRNTYAGQELYRSLFGQDTEYTDQMVLSNPIYLPTFTGEQRHMPLTKTLTRLFAQHAYAKGLESIAPRPNVECVWVQELDMAAAPGDLVGGLHMTPSQKAFITNFVRFMDLLGHKTVGVSAINLYNFYKQALPGQYLDFEPIDETDGNLATLWSENSILHVRYTNGEGNENTVTFSSTTLDVIDKGSIQGA